jgi:hypothetical protein
MQKYCSGCRAMLTLRGVMLDDDAMLERESKTRVRGVW